MQMLGLTNYYYIIMCLNKGNFAQKFQANATHKVQSQPCDLFLKKNCIKFFCV